MAILRNDTDKTFTLVTKSTMYQLKIDDMGLLVNTYYGEKMEYMDMDYASRSNWGASFSPNPRMMPNPLHHAFANSNPRCVKQRFCVRNWKRKPT